MYICRYRRTSLFRNLLALVPDQDLHEIVRFAHILVLDRLVGAEVKSATFDRKVHGRLNTLRRTPTPYVKTLSTDL